MMNKHQYLIELEQCTAISFYKILSTKQGLVSLEKFKPGWFNLGSKDQLLKLKF